VGTTSMEVEVQVIAENPITGERTHTNTAYLVYVALDEAGHKVEVPPLIAETEAERQRMEDGRERQAYRIAQSKRHSNQERSR
jgi:acyl-CoA hydrolase